MDTLFTFSIQKSLETFDMRPTLPSQVEFSCLSAPDIQNIYFEDDNMELDVFTRCGSSFSSKDQPLSQQGVMPSIGNATYIDESAKISMSGHEEDTGPALPDERMSQAAWEGRFDPVRTRRTATNIPPRRFPRTFWRSVTLRLLNLQSRQRIQLI